MDDGEDPFKNVPETLIVTHPVTKEKFVFVGVPSTSRTAVVAM
jgi:hypothetical protein